jgi:hypothetical protein
MKTYEPRTPRTPIVLAAIAMTALTLTLSVIGPAALESGTAADTTVVASHTASAQAET